MSDKTGEEYSNSAEQESLSTLVRSRIVLWAGDFGQARKELKSLHHHHSRQISEAMALRESVRRLEVKVREEFLSSREAQELESEEKRKLQASLIAASRSQHLIAQRERLFVFGGISKVLSIIDSRIARATKQEKIFKDEDLTEDSGQAQMIFADEEESAESLPSSVGVHNGSGFRYTLKPIDVGKWEYRAYRFDRKSMDIERIKRKFTQIEDVSIKLIDHGELDGKPTWPYKFLGFSNQVFVEIRLFDSNRMLVQVAAEPSSNPRVYIDKIFDALK